MTTRESVFFNDDQMEFLRTLIEERMESQANWMENALVHGDPERAARIAKQRNAARDVFAKVNGEILRRNGTISR